MAKKAPSTQFYESNKRADRSETRTPFHIRLTDKERATLAKLTHKYQMSAADVIRMLLNEAA